MHESSLEVSLLGAKRPRTFAPGNCMDVLQKVHSLPLPLSEHRDRLVSLYRSTVKDNTIQYDTGCYFNMRS